MTQRINGDKEAAAQIINGELKRETGKALKAEVVSKAMSRVEFTWDPISSSLYKNAEASHKVGFIRKKPVLDGIYDLRLLEEVLREKNLPGIAN